MNKIIKRIKALFGIYETGFEYVININDIHIQPEFFEHPPKFEKLATKYGEYVKNHRRFDKPVVLNRDFELVDGYCTYLLAKQVGMKRLAVYFVD